FQINPEVYNKARTIGFVENKSIAQVLREAVDSFMSTKKDIDKKLTLVLEPDDEEEILKTIEDNDYISEDEFNKKYNFKK
ncbi:MAG: hypothetical protein AABZ74_06880, partial [Cyanobacteriota bacterium]